MTDPNAGSERPAERVSRRRPLEAGEPPAGVRGAPRCPRLV